MCTCLHRPENITQEIIHSDQVKHGGHICQAEWVVCHLAQPLVPECLGNDAHLRPQRSTSSMPATVPTAFTPAGASATCSMQRLITPTAHVRSHKPQADAKVVSCIVAGLDQALSGRTRRARRLSWMPASSRMAGV